MGRPRRTGRVRISMFGLLLVAMLGLLLVATEPAEAHELGAERFTAPIPLTALFLGAGATVAVTAIWLGRGTRSVPGLDHPVGSFSPRISRLLGGFARLAFGFVVVFVLYRGLVGRQVHAENVATLFVWPVWLKGLALVAVLAGSPWRTLSPWRGIHAILERLEGEEIRFRRYPEWLGWWPAVVGFVAIVGVLENLTLVPRSPVQTAGLVALYAGIMVAGGLVFGRAWFRDGDLLEVLYRQFARVSPIAVRRESDGGARVLLRYPWQGCLEKVTRPGAVTFVVAMVYTVTFDGFTNTPEYQTLQFAATDAAGVGQTTVGVALYLVGLLGFVASFLVAMVLVARLGGTTERAREAARAFVPTVIPIAAAYEFAHNYPFVLQNLARLLELVLEAGGAHHPEVSFLGWLSVPAFWASQVVLIVLGHVVAVVGAHAVAVDRYESLARARRAHLPLVVVMVGYTVLSLWIISRPIVSG